jgi:predicted esterase
VGARLRFSIASATIALTLCAAVSASAAVFDYMSVTGALLRDEDAKSVSIRLDQPGATWRTIFSVERPDEKIAGLSCDRATAALCFIKLVSSEGRSEWRPLRLSGPATPAWLPIEALRGSIVDLDDRAGLALVVESGPATKPSDPAPGVYLWERGERFDQARLLAQLETRCLNAARFIAASAPPNIFISKGCAANDQPAAWIVMTAAGEVTTSFRPIGLPLAIDGDDLIFLARLGPTAADQTVYRFRMPVGPPKQWVGGPVYRPDSAAQRPAIAHTGPEPFPLSAVVLGARIVAVANSPTGPRLFAFCGRDTGGASSFLNPADDSLLDEAGQLQVLSQGGDAAILSAWDRWGERRQFLLRAGACGDASLSLRLLPTTDATPTSRPPLAADFRTIKASDGEAVPYAVLGAAGRHGPILIEAYGAADQPTHAMASVEVERLWVERGGRVVIATVRGDARDPPWNINPTDDYKARAAEDVDEVVEDMVARHEAAPGSVTALGASAGAFTIARAVLMRPDLFSAAVLAAGAFDLQNDFGWLGPTTGDFPQWFAGSRKSDGSCAAVHFFLYQGGRDDRVSPENVAAFGKYLVSLGYHGEVSVNPAAGHFILEDASSGPKIMADLDQWQQHRAACASAASK